MGAGKLDEVKEEGDGHTILLQVTVKATYKWWLGDVQASEAKLSFPVYSCMRGESDDLRIQDNDLP